MTKRLVLLAALLASACLGAPAARAQDFWQLTARQPLVIKGWTRTPIGALQFCLDRPDECEPLEASAGPVPLTDRAWHQLDTVNRRFNLDILPVTDQAFYDRREYWTYPDRYGDCEDYALAKRRALIELGWPADSLLMALVRQSNGDAHAVLVAITDLGHFVLDNLAGDVVGWDQTDYKFIKMQSPATLDRWVELVDDRVLWVASR